MRFFVADVDLFAGLGGPSPVSSAVAAVPAPTPRTPPPEPEAAPGEKPWPPVADGGYCEPYGEVEDFGPPKGRWLRCREPGADCPEPSVETTSRCLDHLRPGDLLDYADSYAVASILYYSGAEVSVEFMRDAQFDGLCRALLEARAWLVVPWLREGMLKAGSGFVLTHFPPELHEAAREWLESDG